jgi:hypothetical protein
MTKIRSLGTHDLELDIRWIDLVAVVIGVEIAALMRAGR